jgi:hypothetical protein
MEPPRFLFYRLKKSEEPSVLLLKLYIMMVNNACNPSKNLASSLGQKKNRVRMETKGMRGARFGELVFDKRGDPILVSR